MSASPVTSKNGGGVYIYGRAGEWQGPCLPRRRRMGDDPICVPDERRNWRGRRAWGRNRWRRPMARGRRRCCGGIFHHSCASVDSAKRDEVGRDGGGHEEVSFKWGEIKLLKIRRNLMGFLWNIHIYWDEKLLEKSQ
uniref:Uncharacterized protein n=1 Tax=Hordeum vulgare subsp. vulgare TaxID=112509 RepID=A0A023INK8_HORVV|nr:hypothetical protein [Hordeum vulgare subsp. vulgare]